MLSYPLNILIADDDKDDCFFFQEAIEELYTDIVLSMVHNGEELMNLLTDSSKQLPHILFLDLNMPRKNGFECIIEIRASKKLVKLPVVVLSTAFKQSEIDQLYNNGAHYYIRKPIDINHLKSVIQQAINYIIEENFLKTTKENFVLKGNIDKVW